MSSSTSLVQFKEGKKSRSSLLGDAIKKEYVQRKQEAPKSQRLLLNSVKHVDPDEGKTEQEPSEQEAEDVEDHEGGEAGDGHSPHLDTVSRQEPPGGTI